MERSSYYGNWKEITKLRSILNHLMSTFMPYLVEESGMEASVTFGSISGDATSRLRSYFLTFLHLKTQSFMLLVIGTYW